MDVQQLKERLQATGTNQADLARFLGMDAHKMSKSLSGKRRFTAEEVDGIRNFFQSRLYLSADVPDADPQRSFVSIKIMPSFAGMGGGGTGDGEPEYGMVPRRLVQDELRANPADLLLIEARGDSMEPDFQHGDQILIDLRDRNPIQPGPFALYDGDAYVIKLVERVPNKKGWYRIFSANGRYSAYEIEEDEQTILGRPVWFARRL